MLEAAVKEMKGESGEERPATQLNLGIALRIDESYVPEENQRLRLYKKIAGTASDPPSTKCAPNSKNAMVHRPMPLSTCLRPRVSASRASALALPRSIASAQNSRFALWKMPPSILSISCVWLREMPNVARSSRRREC